MSAQPSPGQGQLLPADLRRLLGTAFTDEQLSAACAPLEPAVVVAGAGSGKTSVMAARVVWLVATGQVAPEQVLGLTFTNKAAAELAGRIRSALALAGVGAGCGPGAGPVEAAENASAGTTFAVSSGEPTVSTYHAFAGRLVAEHGLRIGVEPRSRLLADATRFQLAARVLRRAPGPLMALTRPLSMLVGDLVALDGELHEHLVPPDRLRTHDEDLLLALAALPKLSAELKKVTAATRARLELVGLVESYREAKRDIDAVDFADQVSLAAELAETRPEVGGLERERYRVVLLDEYQDTSVAQRRMLAGLFGAGHPVTAVGDPCQAIYGWRGASVANLDAFPAHFPCADGRPARVLPLAVSQRSGGLLLRLANAVAAALHAVHRVTELRPRADLTEVGTTLVALHETYAEEMAWTAEQLRASVDAGTSPGQIAVLVRTRADFAAIYAALLEQGLPVEVVGLGGLLGLPEVADLVSTLEVLDDPTSNAALVRLVTGPRWALGQRDLVTLGRQAQRLLRPEPPGAEPAPEPGQAADLPDEVDGVHLEMETDALAEAVSGVDPCDVPALADALLMPGSHGWSAEGRERVLALGHELREMRRHLGEPLLDLLHRVIEQTGLEVELSASPAAFTAGRRNALAAFLDIAAGFLDLDGESSLAAFLAFLRAAEAYDRGLDSTGPSGTDAVQVMTVHKAKGLEWDVVAVPDMTAKVFPLTAVRDRWPTSAHVLPYALRGDADDMPAAPAWSNKGLDAFRDDCGAHLEREERRLAYVAVTRARHMVIASSHWWGPTQKTPRGPSPLLEQLKLHCEAGFGRVQRWVDPPPDGATSPVLAAALELPWPTPLRRPELARRRAAAAEVLAALDRLAAGGEPADPAGLSVVEEALLAEWDHDAALLQAEAAAAANRDRAVVLPRSLSASQVLRLRADPDGLARDLRRPLPRRPVPAARRGTRFHAWVESLFTQHPLLDPEDLPGAEDDGADDDAELAALQAAFLASPYAGRRPFAVEAPFELALAGRVVRGRIDAVYDLAEGRWEVVDWKTGREAADPLQLAIYRLAWARLRGVEPDRVEAAFLTVRTGVVVRPVGLPGAEELGRLLTGPAA
ncbi:MAG: UvrD-helicase domain-containing protein [Actinomycetota bacterium]|nr:UvrD-helicase domain-containing protein [Actinomycetota bacterium]